MGSPNNSDFYAHFAGQDTLYFWADGRKGTPQTLSNIDIDCHGRGNPKSAKAFADWLAKDYLPGLYHEPSTHGTGRHGYFVLFKVGFTDVGAANFLRRLDRTLKKLLRFFLATHPEHEIENVEIKGTPHVITWAKGARRRIETMKSGDLAKLPREILDRFEEFKDTTVLSFDDIEALEQKAEQLVIPAPTRPIPRARGSTSAHPISRDEIDAIGGPYLDFARTWIPEPLGTSGRAMVEAADLAIALPIVKSCSRSRNPDGTMPTARIKGIWDALFQEGVVDRAFDYHRWRVIRNLIETRGGLDMEDRRYFTGFVNHLGQQIRGRAAKWRMTDWLIETLHRLLRTDAVEDGRKLVHCEDSPGDPCIDLHVAEQADSHCPDGFAAILPMGGRERALLEQEEAEDHVHLDDLPGSGGGERALLEQDDDQELADLFDREWIVEFRGDQPPPIGLIWAGSLENRLREAG
jgi:hypothetical protein